MTADDENRRMAADDLRFAAGEHWDERDRKSREEDGRPCLTFPRFNQYIEQVLGDMRLNPPSIRVRPVDGGADVKTAETLTGLVRNIEAQSDAQGAYITAAANAVRCGEGWFGIGYDYSDQSSFHMELAFQRIANPFAVVCDPGATDPTRCDAQHLFLCDMIPTAEFQKRFPDASLDGWDDPARTTFWREGDFVRVAEYWHKKPVQRDLILLKNGATIDITDMDDGQSMQAVQAGGGFVRGRKADGWKVRMQLMSGMEPLEDLYEWPGQYIPRIRVAGNEISLGDRTIRFGLIRYAKDAQRLYNLQRTSLAEAAAMAPKAKWIGTAKQLEKYKAQWARANRSNQAYLLYDADPQAPGAPQRVAPDMPSQAVLADIQASAMDIEATIGMYRDNLGRESNAESGKAILSRQREGDVGTYVFPDNLARGVMQGGRVLIDVLPRIMDTARTVRILGEDGMEDFAPLNTPAVDEFGMPAMDRQGNPVLINDLSVGRYDVVASVGPSFSTRREEARESMMAFFSAAPQAAQVSGDLFAKNMDWPGADEIAKRLRRMLPPGLADPEPDDPPPAPPQPDPNMVLAQAEMVKAQTADKKMQLEAAEAQMNAQIERAKLLLKARELQVDEGQLQLNAIETHAKVANDAMTTQVNAASKAVDALDKAFRPKQPPQPRQPGNRMPRGQQPRA